MELVLRRLVPLRLRNTLLTLFDNVKAYFVKDLLFQYFCVPTFCFFVVIYKYIIDIIPFTSFNRMLVGQISYGDQL